MRSGLFPCIPHCQLHFLAVFSMNLEWGSCVQCADAVPPWFSALAEAWGLYEPQRTQWTAQAPNTHAQLIHQNFTFMGLKIDCQGLDQTSSVGTKGAPIGDQGGTVRAPMGHTAATKVSPRGHPGAPNGHQQATTLLEENGYSSRRGGGGGLRAACHGCKMH